MLNKTLDTQVRYLKGVGPKKAATFNNMGIYTIEDLLYYFPRRYEDRSKFSAIRDLKEGDIQTIRAQVLASGQRQSWKKRQFSILEIVVSDNTASISCVWFNQPYLKNYLKTGVTLILYGKVERYGQRLQISNPEFEIEDSVESLNLARIVPVYSLPQGITQRALRQFIKNTLDEYLPKISDFLPFFIRSKNNLLNLAKSLREIHFPENFEFQKKAYERLCFEEFFLFQLLLALRKRKKARAGIAHCINAGLSRNFIASLPFRLTQAQEKVLSEISADMARPIVMQRLLQGEVGSGKTIVATIAGLIAIQGGYQVVIMVPTEILAKQHYEKIKSQIQILQSGPVKLGLLTSSIPKKDKERTYDEIKNGRINFIIGTHALLDQSAEFKNLGLVIIDEQHKFGVGQRALLAQKGVSPDILIMTATPIPRTLAITLYGDLDCSVIRELPAGRHPVKTQEFTKQEQAAVFAIAARELNKGMQGYIVYPVIEESYAMDIAGAKKMYERLKNNEFKKFKVALIHGKLKQAQQDEIMREFKNRQLDLLVSTTVLEEGIDIPTATCMVIEDAQRFGLSQLHQLRGRIGRGPYESFCLLVSEAKTEEAKARIEAMIKYNDGFRIAEEDLKIRGPGEFFGRRQSGLSELKIGNPLKQMQLLKKAREEAVRLINTDPALTGKQDFILKQKLFRRFPDSKKLISVF